MTPAGAGALDVAALPTLTSLGFTGGYSSFRAFCERAFAADEPRFLRGDRGDLVVFRHADLRTFGAAPEVGAVPPAVLYPQRFGPNTDGCPVKPSAVAEVIANQVFTANPPVHGPVRRILTTWLAPEPVARLEDRARTVARAVLAKLRPGEPVDAVPALAEAMVVGFWSSLVALTPDEEKAMTASVREMTRLFHVTRTAEDTEVLNAAFGSYRTLLEAAAARGLARGDAPFVDLTEALAAIDVADDVTEAGIVPKTVGAFLAGNLVEAFHTAAIACANTLNVLLERPDAMAAVRADPKLLHQAVPEALRLAPPVLLLQRHVLRDFHCDGFVVPKGTRVSMFWAAGDHDPKAFPDPRRFDLARRLQGLTTFGGGAHLCPGRYAAPMLTRVLLEEMFRARIELVPAGEARWLDAHLMSQLETLPVRCELPGAQE
ncbi:MAG: cytochrome P450 [Hyphomicrobiales bacterium]